MEIEIVRVDPKVDTTRIKYVFNVVLREDSRGKPKGVYARLGEVHYQRRYSRKTWNTERSWNRWVASGYSSNTQVKERPEVPNDVFQEVLNILGSVQVAVH